jgi:hypothetical protein
VETNKTGTTVALMVSLLLAVAAPVAADGGQCDPENAPEDEPCQQSEPSAPPGDERPCRAMSIESYRPQVTLYPILGMIAIDPDRCINMAYRTAEKTMNDTAPEIP